MRVCDCAVGRSGATPRGLIEKQLDSSAHEIAEVYALCNEAKETFARYHPAGYRDGAIAGMGGGKAETF